MRYKISTVDKKSVVETNEWTKDSHSIRFETLWGWGWVEVTTKPNLSKYDEDEGIDILDEFDPVDQELSGDGGGDVEYSESMSDADIEEVEAILEEDGESGLLEAGWEPGDREVIFRGPLKVEKIK